MTTDLCSIPCIPRPSRSDRRIVRQILANLVDGQPCPDLDRIANSSLSRIIRFLSAVRGLKFVFVARGHGGATFGYCGPKAVAARDIAPHVLGFPLPHSSPPLATEMTSPAAIVQDAVERVVDILSERTDISFTLVWQVEESEVEVEYSVGLSRSAAEDEIRWFVTERLNVPLPNQHVVKHDREVAPW